MLIARRDGDTRTFVGSSSSPSCRSFPTGVAPSRRRVLEPWQGHRVDDLPALEPDFESEGQEMVLHQDRFWWDIKSRRWPLELMDFDYLQNVLRFLEQQASRLYHREVSRAIISDEEPPPPAASAEEAVAWVRSTVLYAAIKRRVAAWP